MRNTVFLRTPPPVEPSSIDRIRDAAIKTFAAHGVAATSFRMVAEAAGTSIGLVQHYFHAKAALVAAIDDYVVQVIGEILESSPLPEPPADPLIEIGRRVTTLLRDHSEVMDYVGRALLEGDRIGSVVFDGLLEISAAQRDLLTDQGLTRPDLDPLWAALNPLLLRMSAVLLRTHIERHLPEPFTSPAQLQRWDTAVTRLIREGQTRAQSEPDNTTP
jgi:TetR/AcrR family transcriptional regulator, regulator of cefoperazone and chloramphenicol sensitivity